MEYQREQQDYFDDISEDYGRKYEEPDSILEYEKIRRMSTAFELLTARPHENLLEIGVGSGEFLHRYREQYRETDLIGVDLSASMIAAARDIEPSPLYCQGSITSLPVETDSVDVVVCLGVVGYVDSVDLGAVFNECARVLEPGGQLIVSFANRQSPFRRARQFYYYRFLEAVKAITGLGTPVTSGYNTYAPATVLDTLSDSGFDVTDTRYLTYSTGIWDTRINARAYEFLEERLNARDSVGALAMTWVVSAQT